jgi:hypothetical protein
MKKAIKLTLISVVLVGVLGLYACQSVSKSKSNDLPDEFTVRSVDWKESAGGNAIAATANIKRLKDNLYEVSYIIDRDVLSGKNEMFGQGFGYNFSNLSLFNACVSSYLTIKSGGRYYQIGDSVGANVPKYDLRKDGQMIGILRSWSSKQAPFDGIKDGIDWGAQNPYMPNGQDAYDMISNIMVYNKEEKGVCPSVFVNYPRLTK